MTEDDKALVGWISETADRWDEVKQWDNFDPREMLHRSRDRIGQLTAEIERLREALGEIMERGGAFGGIWCALAAQEALAGDSHDQ